MPDQVTDNKAKSRYELPAHNGLAIAAYDLDGNVITFTHTVVPEPLRGRGLASRLIGAALADARTRGLEIRPQCPFVADYLKRHQTD